MVFEYHCTECEEVFDVNFRIGQAPPTVVCPECQGESKRLFSCNFILKGGGWPSKKGRFNKEMTDRNEAAGRRMKIEHGEHGPVRLAALDYGDGDVREVEK